MSFKTSYTPQFREDFKEQKISYTFLYRAIQSVKGHMRLCYDLHSYTEMREENTTGNR